MIRRARHSLDRLTAVVERLTRGDLDAVAPETGRNPSLRALAQAVNSLGSRSRAEAEAEREAEQFRQRTRLISATIRRTTNAGKMAEHLVRGLGQAFEVDRVWMHTFDDERVPQLSASWNHERLEPFSTAMYGRIAATRPLANRLWETSDVLCIDDHRNHDLSLAGLGSTAIAQETGTTASLVVPIGDGDSAFGLVWLSMAAHSRHWTQTELGVAQHLATDLAHSLVQAHVIEQQARAVQMLKELDQAKADFISTVSHELRTPLTSIAGYLEMLQDGEAGTLSEDARRMLSIVDRNSVRLRNLIEDLLTQSRIDAGRLRLDITRVNLQNVLSTVRTALLPAALSAHVTVEELTGPEAAAVETHTAPILLDADPHQLEQVFTNLLSNAIKFSRAGANVEISYGTDDEGDGVFVQITDSGIGVPAEELDRLFTRFFRASNASAAVLPGTGLGLAIVREIVTRHGGAVEFDSTVSAGTTVTVWLPRSVQVDQLPD